MDGLRVLLIEKNAEESERISSVLANAHHDVLPTNGFEDASEALLVQRFDAVLLGSPLGDGAAEFTTKLRQLERNQRTGGRTPVLSFSPQVAKDTGRTPSDVAVDGYLPRQFNATVFSETVHKLAQVVGKPNEASAAAIAELPIFEPEQFQAQVAHDRDLLIEIIDLFLTERAEQVKEMRTALNSGDYNRLSRAAHTLKGSLASLHAQQAKAHAQEIEYAAKNQETQVCRFSLAQLEQDLDILEPHLIALRQSSSH